MSAPRHLYKYETFSTQSLLNLKRQIIYFGSPLNFNDPYDCGLTPNIKNPSEEEIDSILKANSTPVSGQAERANPSYEELRDIFASAGSTKIKEIILEFLKTHGVACFSESNDNLLMWSHYGGSYKGFCLEFTTDAEIFRKVRKVHYSPNMPSLDIANYLINKSFDMAQVLFCTKSINWSYENEWRVIHNVAGTQLAYPSEALTGLYFGPDIDEQSIEIICLILASQNQSIRLWRGIRSTTEFRVLFKEFS